MSTMTARLLAECRAKLLADDDLWILGDFYTASKAAVNALILYLLVRMVWYRRIADRFSLPEIAL